MKYKYEIDETLGLPRRCLEMLFEAVYDSQPCQENPLSVLLCHEIYGDTPIEKIFHLAYLLAAEKRDCWRLYLSPQYEVECGDKKYRVDFMYSPKDDGYNTDFRLAIECDGHDYHKQNKQQIASENQREYDLKMNHIDVLHFSGSQIYNDPFGCANKVIDYILEKGGDLNVL